MATSEYISERKASKRGDVHPFSAVRPRSRGHLGAALMAPLPMIFNDALAILLAVVASLVLRDILLDRVMRLTDIQNSIGPAPLSMLYLAWFVLVYALVARRYGLYGRVLQSASGSHEMRMTAQACLNAGLLLCGVLYLAHNLNISRAVVVLLTLCAIVSLCCVRGVARLRRYSKFERGLATRNVVILGTNHLGFALGRQIKSQLRLGYTLRGFLLAPGCDAPAGSWDMDVLGALKDLRQVVRKHFVDEIIIAESCPVEQVIRILKEARDLGIDVRSISGYYNDLATNAALEYLGVFPLVSLHRQMPRTISLAIKRAADFLFSLVAVLAVAPAMIAIAIAIRMESGGPVFYVANRIGKRGRVFPCFKFRTMVSNADQLKKHMEDMNERDGILFKVKNDPRITPLGRFLRKYSLDELPQFFNVLRGEMSLVGPRPPIASEVEKYKLEHLRRLEVLPGLTGLWQVQARQDSSFEKYIALDTAYVEHWSFWLDLKILFRTAEVVLRGTGT